MRLPRPAELLHEPQWRRRWAWLWAVQILGVGVAALTPGDAAVTLSASDKFDHLLAFGVLAVTGVLALRRGPTPLLCVACVLLAYGGFIELAQTQIPGRFGDWSDVLADAGGVAAGLSLALALRRRWAPGAD